MDGYIKIFRRIKDWEWYDDPNIVSLWIHLLVDANREDSKWRGETIRRGSLMTSIAKLVADTGLTDRQVRTCLSRLVKTGEITMKTTNKWTEITVRRYDVYQAPDEAGKRMEEVPPPTEPMVVEDPPILMEEKIEENVKPSYDDAVERIYKLYPSSTKRPEGNTVSLKSSKKNKAHIKRMLTSKEYTEESLSYAIRRYIEETSTGYLKQFETFLNQVPDYSQSAVEQEQHSMEDEMQRALNPTKEETDGFFRRVFAPRHPALEGEDSDAYWTRMRGVWERERKAWIERRVDAVNNKY